MAVLKVQVETERDGIVRVRALAAPGREMDAKPVAGFFVRRRFEGDEFMLANWHEFSPRWMQFVDKPPQDWLDKINAREQNNLQVQTRSEAENAKTPEQRIAETMFSMASVMKDSDAGTINMASGKVTPPKTLSLNKGAAA